MSNALFPNLIGATWDIQRQPRFKTEIQESVSGREVRAALMPYPLDEWTLHYEYLPQATDFATLIGFYKARRGAFDSFLFTAAASDGTPIDSQVAAQGLGTADGVAYDFPLVRALGGFSEFVENGAISAVYFNGVVQSAANYICSSVAPGFNNTLHFTSTPSRPAAGVAVAADFTYSWRVRFKDDTLAFGNFISRLWEAKTVALVQV
jgi:uncharacterized protein (TIGR02217 family)